MHSQDLLNRIVKYSDYLLSIFRCKIASFKGSLDPPLPPDDISLAFLVELELLAGVLARAYHNPSQQILFLARAICLMPNSEVRMPWSVRDYCRNMTLRPSGFDSALEQELLKKFPPLNNPPFPTTFVPSCILDIEGSILSWYLPNCLTLDRQVRTLQNLCYCFKQRTSRNTFGILHPIFNPTLWEVRLMEIGETWMNFSSPAPKILLRHREL
jgi:hypothetical protein